MGHKTRQQKEQNRNRKLAAAKKTERKVSPLTHQENRTAPDKNARPNDEQHGNKNAAPSVAIGIEAADEGKEFSIPNEKAKNASTEHSPAKPTARDQKRSHDRRILIANTVIAGTATASVIVALVQLWFIWRQLDAMRGQLTAMNEQGKIMSGQLNQAQEDSKSGSLASERQLTIMSSQLAAMNEQTKAMSGQLEQMRTDSESSSRTSDRQLAIMEGQLAEMRAAAQLEQRAWIGLPKAQHQTIVQGKPIEGEFTFANTGKTPAIIVTAGRTTCVRPPKCDMEALAATKEEEAWMKETRSQGPLAPNATMAINFSTEENVKVSDSLVADIKSGKVCVYVVGKIVYHDIFGIEHQTRFCYVVDPSTDHMTVYHQYN